MGGRLVRDTAALFGRLSRRNASLRITDQPCLPGTAALRLVECRTSATRTRFTRWGPAEMPLLMLHATRSCPQLLCELMLRAMSTRRDVLAVGD